MLKIRLQRTGRINDPSFRIVVIEHTESTKSGSIVERVGSYNPKTKERVLAADRIKYWLSVGAKASGTMHNMLISAGIITGKKVNVLPKKSPPKQAESEQKTPVPSEGGGATGQAVNSEQPEAVKEEVAAEESKEAEPVAEEKAVA